MSRQGQAAAQSWLFILLILVSFNASAAVLYVDVNSGTPTPPFRDWTTAATTIQDAIDVAVPGDQILVTNGVYQMGGAFAAALTNRIAITKVLTVQSVNGPGVTVIQGYQVPGTTNGVGAVRCAYLTNGATLTGFTLANGSTSASGSGGGVWCQSTNAVVSDCVLAGNAALVGGGANSGTLNNCTLVGNQAIGGSSNNRGGGAAYSILNHCTLTFNSAFEGAGAFGSVLNNCVFTGNISSWLGGGASQSTLNNCIVTGNSAVFAAGVMGGRLVNSTVVSNSASSYSGGVHEAQSLVNCIVYYNSAPLKSDIDFGGGTANYCCVPSLPTLPNHGTGNITNEPAFVDLANGDFHLQSNSICINAGTNSGALPSSDLTGNPRIAGGTVDIGAYEFQTPVSAISYSWLQQYGLPIAASTENEDPDGDGLNNWQEWQAGTNPTNAASVLLISAASFSSQGVTITWQSVQGKSYVLEQRPDLAGQSVFLPLATNIVGQVDTTTYTGTNVVYPSTSIYRVGVQ